MSNFKSKCGNQNTSYDQYSTQNTSIKKDDSMYLIHKNTPVYGDSLRTRMRKNISERKQKMK